MSTGSAPVVRLLRPIPKLKPAPARPQAALSPAKAPARIIAPVQRHPIPTHGAGSTPVRLDPDILTVEEVALILRCKVDTARRIPRDQLPAHPGPGRHRLYLREDVLAYVRRLGRPTPNAGQLLTGAAAKVLGLPADRVKRERR
jgi:hypothetical protein